MSMGGCHVQVKIRLCLLCSCYTMSCQKHMCECGLHAIRDGCHHCGKKQGRCVGDHIPPNKQVWGSSKDLTSQVQKVMGTTRKKPPRIKPSG